MVFVAECHTAVKGEKDLLRKGRVALGTLGTLGTRFELFPAAGFCTCIENLNI